MRESGVPGSHDTWVPGRPRRRDYLLLALFFTVIAVYGSLVPLEYKPLDFREAVEQFREIRYLKLGVDARADWVANILLFIPISYCWLAVFTVDRRFSGLTVLAAVLLVGHPALGWLYLIPVGLAAVDLVMRNLRLLVEPTPKRAFSLFKASNLYLALVLLLICVDALV